MSWKRGQAGGFPGLLPARWELFLPRRKARGVMLGKRPSSTPDRSGIRIVPYMGQSLRPGSRGLSHIWDNPPSTPNRLGIRIVPYMGRSPGEPRTVPYVGQSPLPKGPRSYARKASPSMPDRPGIRIVPYMGRSPRTGSRGLSHMWDNPPCRRAGMFHMGGQSPSSRNRSVPQSGRHSATHHHLFHPEG
jgi:hypothetical protein